MLVVAANRDSSIADIERFFGVKGVERSRSWIQRRRWLFDKEDAIHPNGPKPNADGNNDQAVATMREFPCVSVRHLVVLLKERGITRSPHHGGDNGRLARSRGPDQCFQSQRRLQIGRARVRACSSSVRQRGRNAAGTIQRRASDESHTPHGLMRNRNEVIRVERGVW